MRMFFNKDDEWWDSYPRITLFVSSGENHCCETVHKTSNKLLLQNLGCELLASASLSVGRTQAAGTRADTHDNYNYNNY